MPSKESCETHKEEKSLVQKAKREANQEDILAAALGMRMGPEKASATFWQPLKLFAYSQLTSLVRRASLKESERSQRPEKVHNFKVSLMGDVCQLVEDAAFVSSRVARGQLLTLPLKETGWGVKCLWSVWRKSAVSLSSR